MKAAWLVTLAGLRSTNLPPIYCTITQSGIDYRFPQRGCRSCDLSPQPLDLSE
jgi:hypothetical protein